MSSLFVSHSSEDNEAASRLIEVLRKQGYESIFLDFDPDVGIAASRDWEKEIFSQLQDCRALMILCSEHSMASRWCFLEVGLAKAMGKPIFPIKIGPCEIDPVLSVFQYVDLSDGAEDGKSESYGRLWRGLRTEGFDPNDDFGWDRRRPPYPGMLAFEVEDAGIYFGREKDVHAVRDTLRLMQHLRSAAQPRLLLVVGDSGCGKSSLVRAGVVPRLRKDPDHWLVVPPFRPGQKPVDRLAEVLRHALPEKTRPRDWKEISGRLVGDDARITAPFSDPSMGAGVEMDCPLGQILTEIKTAHSNPDPDVLLVIDQFEEILGSAASAESARSTESFLYLLGQAIKAPESPLMVLGTLRSDFLVAFQNQAVKWGVPFNHVLLDPLPLESLAEVIEGPARREGIEFEERLVNRMVKETGTEHALPLLAFTLRAMYDRCTRPRRFTERLYWDELGGIQGAVKRVADQIVKHISPDADRDLRRSFLKMVQVNDEGQFVRREVSWDDLPSGSREILERFVVARLLASCMRDTVRTLEVAHEALFKVWPKLKSWLDENRDFLRWRKRVEKDIDDWVNMLRSEDYLLTGARLAETKKWLEEPSVDLSELEREFIQRSWEREERTKIAKWGALRGDEEAIKAQLEASRYEEAKKRLDEALTHLEHETDPDLVKRREDLSAQQERVGRLVTFYQLARRVYSKAGEEEYEKAVADCEEALGTAGVKALVLELETRLETCGVADKRALWRKYLPADDLSDEQLEPLKHECYRQLILLSALRTKPGLIELGNSAKKSQGGMLPAKLGKVAVGLAQRLLPASSIFELVKKRFDKNPAAVAKFERALQALRWVATFEQALAFEDLIGKANVEGSAAAAEPINPEKEHQFRPSIISQIINRVNLFGIAVADPRGDTTFEDLVQEANLDESAAAAEPTHPADFYFLGLMHFFIGKFQNSILTTMIASFQRLFPELDHRTPLDTAERLLRAGISREPDNFWPHFVLGRTFLSRGEAMRRSRFKRLMNVVLGRADVERDQYISAELAFNSCISLQPDYARGYEQRAVALGLQWQHMKGRGPLKEQLRKRAKDDSKMAEEKADNDPSTYWPRGDLLAEFGEAREALDAYARALELEENILEKMSRGTRVNVVFDLAEAQVEKHRNRAETSAQATLAEAHAVMALVHFIKAKFDAAASDKAKFDAAASDAARALEVRPNHPHALTARGMVLLEQGKPGEAAIDFRKVLAQDPANYLAALRLVTAYATLSDHDQALEFCDLLLRKTSDGSPAAPEWMQGKALLARARALKSLGRNEEAEEALREAKLAKQNETEPL